MTTNRSRRKPARRTSRWRAPLLGAGGLLALAGLTWLVFQGFTATPARPAASSGPGMVGRPAPAVALPATTGGQVALDQFRGSKVVVYFYEGAG